MAGQLAAAKVEMKRSPTFLAPVAASAIREINQVSYGACHTRSLKDAQVDGVEPDECRPERRLAAAVLIRAAKDVADIGMHDVRYEDVIGEVTEWASADHRTGGHEFWSFGDVCEILGIDPDVVRPMLISGELGRSFENGRCLGGGR